MRMTKIVPENTLGLPQKISKEEIEERLSQLEAPRKINHEEATISIQRWWKSRVRRKWWNTMRKLQKKQAKRFVQRVLMGLLVFLIARMIFGGATDINLYALNASMYMWVSNGLVFSRLLLLDKKDVKMYAYSQAFIGYNTLGLGATLLGAFIQLIGGPKFMGDVSTYRLVGFIVYCILAGLGCFYGIARLQINLHAILNHYHKKRMHAVSYEIMTKFISILPLVLYPILQTIGYSVTAHARIDNLCQYIPGAQKVSKWRWKNCTEMIEVEDGVFAFPQLDLYYPQKVNTALDAKRQAVINSHMSHITTIRPLMYQSYTPPLLALVSISLFQVCRVSVRDLLTCRGTILEVYIGATVLMIYIYTIVASQMSMPEHGYTPSQYANNASNYEEFIQYFGYIPVFAAMGFLIYRAQQVVKLESLPLKERDLSKYNSQVQIIYRRGLKLDNDISNSKNNHNHSLTHNMLKKVK